jgi:16S rRNA (uracil1498-N3)-methyltransferase
MRRYWINKDQIQTSSELLSIVFEGDQFHHIFIVCRQTVGHQFEALTEDGIAYLVEVTKVLKKTATVKILSQRKIPERPKPYIHLALSVPRFSVLDSICEKAVEMGVHKIIPFVSDFSFIRETKDFADNKIERLSKIVLSATQQSGRGDLMKIEPISHMSQVIDKIGMSDFSFFAYEGETQTSIENEINRLKSKHIQPPENIWIFVGSEGGFSVNEVKKLTDLGLNPVTLGGQILRVETACMTLVSVLKYEFGLME